MKNYCFRAVYFKNRQDGEVDYRSAPISEAEEPYETLGVYDLSERNDSIEEKHVADMPREEFQLVLDSRFPNGFESWQKSHYEITLFLNYDKSEKQTYSVLAQLAEFGGKWSCHALALYLTNEFETFKKEKPVKDENLSMEIKQFLESYDYKLPGILMHIF